MHENTIRYHNLTRTELGKLIGDLVASSQDMEVPKAVEIIF
jgi:hypothetical protein